MWEKKLSLAVIDDDFEDIVLLRANLEGVPGLEFELNVLSDPDSPEEVWDWHEADVIFLDYSLGGDTGLDVLKSMRASGDLRPVIVLSGMADPQIAAELVRAGADGYIDKRYITAEVLQRSLQHALAPPQRRNLSAAISISPSGTRIMTR